MKLNGNFKGYFFAVILVFILAFGFVMFYSSMAGAEIHFEERFWRPSRQKPAVPDDPLFCNYDTDCATKYNVSYQEECLAGCFNKKVETDQSCQRLWEQFAAGTRCICEDQKCKLVPPEEKTN